MIAIVWTRLAAAGLLLVALSVAYLVLGSLFSLLVSLALVAVPALSWLTYWFFARRSVAHPEMLALRVQVQDALALALASSTAGALGLFAVFRAAGLVAPEPGIFLVGLSFALLMIAAPAVNWLVTWKPWAD